MWSKWVESVRKDVECTFGILKGRFTILKAPLRYHKLEYMDNVWMTCCALHNMLLEVEHGDRENAEADNEEDESQDAVVECDVYDEEAEEAQRRREDALWAQQNEAINGIMEMNVDFSVLDNIAAPDDPSYPNGSDVIPLNKLQLKVFRSRLIKHFAICKMMGQIRW
jgi:Plant transposon protein